MTSSAVGGLRRPVPWPGLDRRLSGDLVSGVVPGTPGIVPRPPAPIRRRLAGLDIAQRADFSALAVVDQDGPDLRLVGLERTRGLDYVSLAYLVRDTIRALAPLTLVVDCTGVGLGIADLLTRLGLPHIRVVIHGGNRVTKLGAGMIGAPKADLVAAVVVALESRRLRVAGGLPLADALEREANGYSVKLSASGHASYSAPDGQHDDLVIAVSLPVWWAGRSRPPAAAVSGGARSGPLASYVDRASPARLGRR